jgi:hypothetical protein
MPKFLPSPFGLREWLLMVTALTIDGVALWLCRFAGLGVGGLLFSAVVLGTILFVCISGRNRIFFTGVFTSVLSLGIYSWSVVSIVFIDHESFYPDYLVMPFVLFLFYVLIPVAFAWLVTLMFRKLERPQR